MRFVLPLAVAGLFISLALPASSQSILIWDRDYGDNFQDPEGAGLVGCEYAIQQALTGLGYTYTTVTALPLDLSPYDMVFFVGGAYC